MNHLKNEIKPLKSSGRHVYGGLISKEVGSFIVLPNIHTRTGICYDLCIANVGNCVMYSTNLTGFGDREAKGFLK